MRARAQPVVIPNQEPDCSSDGNGHFDCRIRVIYESPAGPASQQQTIHIRRTADSWIIDSLN